MRKGIIAFTLLASAGLSGCATIVSGTHSSTYFETSPENARCELAGHKFNAVVNTPGSLSLPSSAAPIQVSCTSKGYRPGTAKLDTSANGWMAGNVLFGLLGGGVGLLVDAASGAGQQFPPRLSVVLEPERFASVVERDKWYADREASVKASWENAIEQKTAQCRQLSYSTNDVTTANCRTGIKSFEAQRDSEIKRLEDSKATAVIGPPDANGAPAGNPAAAPSAPQSPGQASSTGTQGTGS